MAKTNTTTIKKYEVKCVREKNYTYECQVKAPEHIYRFMSDVLKVDQEPVESFYAFALNAKNEIIGYSVVSRGGLDSAPVHPRNVFQFLISCNAAFGIVAHNHPTGDTKPSKSDIEVTKRLEEAGKIFGDRNP